MMADCGHGPLGMSVVSDGGDGATAGKPPTFVLSDLTHSRSEDQVGAPRAEERNETVSYDCYKNHHKLGNLKQGKFIIFLNF